MESSDSSLLKQLGTLEDCFGIAERTRLCSAVELAAERCPGAIEQLEETVRQAARSLPLVVQAIDAMPRVLASQRMGQRERDPETLVETLCQSKASLEFSMPTRAVLGRAFVLAKLNVLKALRYVMDEAGEGARHASTDIGRLVDETILAKLAEELLAAAVANPFNSMELRRAAARKLIPMWDERRTLPVSQLHSVLLSAWQARLQVRAEFGTLIGVVEVFSLILAECEPRFVDFFVRDHVTDDESEAFREFLFGLPYEDIEKVRRHMEEQGRRAISRAEVQELIGTAASPVQFGDPSPEQMYDSYWRRRIRAESRAISHQPGPRKTAEGYIMEHLLQKE